MMVVMVVVVRTQKEIREIETIESEIKKIKADRDQYTDSIRDSQYLGWERGVKKKVRGGGGEGGEVGEVGLRFLDGRKGESGEEDGELNLDEFRRKRRGRLEDAELKGLGNYRGN